MPKNVLEYVKVDHVETIDGIGELLVKISRKNAVRMLRRSAKEKQLLEMEVIISMKDNAFEMGIMNMGELTPFTCPECHGALVQLKGKLMRFRCHTDHAFTASSLLTGISQTVEDTMWQSMRALEESTMLLNKMSVHFKSLKHGKAAKLFRQKAKINSDQARIIHDSISRQQQLSEDLRHQGHGEDNHKK